MLETIYKNRCNESGRCGHFFDNDTMQFFNSHICYPYRSCKNGIIFFVTSERSPYGKRKFSVRKMELDGDVNTIGEFCSLTEYKASELMNEYADRENKTKY